MRFIAVREFLSSPLLPIRLHFGASLKEVEHEERGKRAATTFFPTPPSPSCSFACFKFFPPVTNQFARSRAISSSSLASLPRFLARQNVPLTFMKRGHNIRGKSVKVNQLSLPSEGERASEAAFFTFAAVFTAITLAGRSLASGWSVTCSTRKKVPTRNSSEGGTKRPSTRLLLVLVRSSFVLAPFHSHSFPSLLLARSPSYGPFSPLFLSSPLLPFCSSSSFS